MCNRLPSSGAVIYFIQMNLLNRYGWDKPRQEFLDTLNTSLKPARIISVRGFKYYIITETGEVEAELSGKLLFESENDNLPKVGDWILYIAYDDSGYIVEVLPRKKSLSRKNPGKKVERQILAANVDYALIVQGLDRDFNLMRLDRYLVQVSACGITPIVVLNKSDLVDSPERYIEEVNRLGRTCEIFICSTYSNDGIDEIRRNALRDSQTYVLIGSSGAGKSSLLNAVTGREFRLTGEVSDFNSKGKHTTTSRDLFLLPMNAMVIDNPGMREFGLTFEDSASGDEFPLIAEFAVRCKFNDCKHLNETGCAVLEALNSGALDPIAYESYIKLIKEQRRFQISAEEKKQQARQWGKITKEAKNHRKKYKF
jgi:ribosome biogenesis GTPase / thiamine phosphate phosphatase